MTKKLITFVVLSSLIIGSIGGWLLMRFVLPKLNTFAILRKYNLNPKTAPLVINTREEVRVNEGSDSIAAIQRAKPWVVSLLAGADQAHAQVQGAGVIVTSDGLIATVKSALPAAQPYRVALSDGTVQTVTVVATDSASDLVFLKANTNGLPTAPLGFPKDLQLGQRIVVLSPSLSQYQGSDSVSFLSTEIKNLSPSQIYSSERLHRTFGISSVFDAQEGAAVLSLDANVQGLFSKSGIVTAETIKSAQKSYFASGAIQRPSLGVYYQVIPTAVAKAFNLSEGVLLKKPDNKTAAVVAGSAASKAGLQEGDLITKINETQISVDNSFEELLANFSPAQTATFSVLRNGQTVQLSVTFGSH